MRDAMGGHAEGPTNSPLLVANWTCTGLWSSRLDVMQKNARTGESDSIKLWKMCTQDGPDL